MKNKLTKILFAMLSLMLAIAFAVSCDTSDSSKKKDDDDGHTHEFGRWRTVKIATCVTEGEEERECRECGETESRPVPVSGNHTFSAWKTVIKTGCFEDGEEERKCKYCTETERRTVKAPGEHSYGNDNICTNCNEKLVFTEGLEYVPTEDGESFVLVGGAPETGEVIIPPYHQGKPVVGIGEGAFAGISGITGVTMPDSVHTISDGAFFGCSGLTDLVLPKGLQVIGNSAFEGCTLIVIVIIPEGVTEIGQGAFKDCDSLESVTVPEGVTNIAEATFKGCESLTEVKLPESLTDVGNEAFADCVLIVVIVLGENVEAIGQGAFFGCTSLEEINIPSGVTDILENVFAGCESLVSITLPETLKNICSGAFSGCIALERIDGGNLEWISPDAFDGCESLEKVPHTHVYGDFILRIPAGCETEGEEYRVCAECYTEDVRAIEPLGHSLGAWVDEDPASCDKLGTKGHYVCSACGSFFDIDENKINTLVLPKAEHTLDEWYERKEPGCVTDGWLAHYTCTACYACFDSEKKPLTDYVLFAKGHNYENGLCTKCGATTASEGLFFAEYADGYYYVSGIGRCKDTDIVIPAEYNGKPVTGIEASAFISNTYITSVVIPDSVKTIKNSAFYECTALKTVVMGSGVTKIENAAFRGCRSLKSIVIPDSVTELPGMIFYECYSLSDIVLPAKLTSIGKYAFTSTSLTQIKIPSSVSYIGDYAFSYCNKLARIELPLSIDIVNPCTFSGCTALSSATMQGVKTICDSAFANCSSLTSVTVGELESVVYNAFDGCTALANPPHTHISDGNWVSYVAPTCEKDGVVRHSGCLGCDKKLDENGNELETTVIPAEGHQYGALIEGKTPTCEDDGWIEHYHCDLCGTDFDAEKNRVQTTVIEAEGHTLEVWQDSVAPTCQKDGMKGHYFCDVCDKYFDINGAEIEDVVIPSTGEHVFGTWTVTKEPTCKEEGVRERKCSGCGTSEHMAISKTDAHEFGEWVQTKAPTCLCGELTRKCSVCDATETDSVAPIKSHKLDKYNTCSECLTTVTATEGLLFEINSAADGYVVYQGTATGDVVIPTYYEGLPVKEIGENAFYGCGTLTSVVIPEQIEKIGVYAFYNCTKLKTVYYNAISCADFAQPYSGRSNGVFIITGMDGGLDLVIGSEVKRLPHNMFYNDYYYNYAQEGYGPKIASITISDGCALSEIPMLFRSGSSCSTAFYVNDLETWLRVSACFYEFFNSSSYSNGEPLNLGTIYIGGEEPVSVVIPAGITQISDYAFANARKLKSVTIPEGVTKIGNNAFKRCYSLESIDIPASVETVGEFAFNYCFNLKSVEIKPDGELQYIEKEAFSECTSLASFILPEKLCSIGSNAFSYCYRLVEVYNLTKTGYFDDLTAGTDNYGGIAYYAKSIRTSISESTTVTTPDGFVFHVSTGGVTLIGYVGNDEVLILPDGYNGMTYEIGSGAFYESDIREIVISSYVTKIGEYAFQSAASLERVRFEKGSRLTEIGQWAFYKCTNLASLYIPSSVTYVGGYICHSVREKPTVYCAKSNAAGWDSNWLKLDSWGAKFTPVYGVSENSIVYTDEMDFVIYDTVATLYRYFGYSLILNVPAYVSDGTVSYPVTTVYGTVLSARPDVKFAYVPSTATSVSLYGIVVMTDSGAVSSGWQYYQLFGNCSKDTVALIDGMIFLRSADAEEAILIAFIGTENEVIIPDTVVIGSLELPVTEIYRNAFYATDIERVKIGANVRTVYEYAFMDCKSLKSIEFTESGEINSIRDGVFQNCSALVEISIPAPLYELGSYAFSGCSSLKTVKLPAGMTALGVNILSGCGALEELTLPFIGTRPQAETDSYQRVLGHLFSTEPYNGSVAVEQNHYDSYKNASNYSYSYTTFYIPASLRTVRVEGGNIVSFSFMNCTMIEVIELGEGVTAAYTDWLRGTCADLVVYCDGNPSGVYASKIHYNVKDYGWFDGLFYLVTDEGAAVAGLDGSTTEIFLPDYVVLNGVEYRVVGVAVGAFSKSDITAFYGCYGMTKIGGSAFFDCTSLVTVELPVTVTEIGISAFSGCSSLTSFTVPKNVKNLENGIFARCTSLSLVNLPATLETVGEYAFQSCESLVSIALPDSVTQLYAYAFEGCSALESVNIPRGVSAIRSYTFLYCTSLREIVIPENVKYIYSGAFSYCTSLSKADFEAKSTWYVTRSIAMTNGTYISVYDSESIAYSLRSSYSSYYWYRK